MQYSISQYFDGDGNRNLFQLHIIYQNGRLITIFYQAIQVG